MAIPKTGSRKIIVDDIKYRWTVRKRPTYTQSVMEANMQAAVELYEEPGSVLSINFPWVRYDSFIGIPQEPVTPKLIEQSVRTALQKGWLPEKKGSAFTLDYEKE